MNAGPDRELWATGLAPLRANRLPAVLPAAEALPDDKLLHGKPNNRARR